MINAYDMTHIIKSASVASINTPWRQEHQMKCQVMLWMLFILRNEIEIKKPRNQ